MRNTLFGMALALLAGPAMAGSALAETSPADASTHHHPAHHHARALHRQAGNLAALGKPTAASPAVAEATTAPVPNEGVTAPIDTKDQETSIAPSVMQIHYPPMGDGYTTGSSAQAMDDREAAKVTGVQVRMPLGQ